MPKKGDHDSLASEYIFGMISMTPDNVMSVNSIHYEHPSDMVNIMGHVNNKEFALKTLGIILLVHVFANSQYIILEVLEINVTCLFQSCHLFSFSFLFSTNK